MIYYNPNGPKNIVPLSKTIILSGVVEAMEISEMIRLVAKVSGIYIIYNLKKSKLFQVAVLK